MALHILVVRATGSGEEYRSHHVAELVATEVETLLDWGQEDLGLLAGSKWAEVALACKADIEQEFSELQEVIGDFLARHNIGLTEFLWAQKILISRMVQFAMADGSLLCVLGLGQDMFNHSPDAPCGNDDVNLEASERTGDQLLVIRAYRDFQAGEQAFYSYSAASNGRLLMNAGFVSGALYEGLARGLDAGLQRPGCAVVAEDARPEFLELLPADRELHEEASQASLHVRLGARGAPPAQLERVLAFLRLGRLCCGGGAPSQEALARSDADAGARRGALAQLQASLSSLLQGYPASLEQDEERLPAIEAEAAAAAAGSGARRRAAALRVVAGEKRTLRATLQTVGAMLEQA
ncbi:unnamed protein product [Prorocentrum cordatum]|uniref:Rubisco LSMT substrate-binding domain-containing protein n=1 Tax=Prorocentrum cordatum TaxID=2364126 RepID=A0ABN9SR11_9DINO|nr:unnamed protein product [Polarella glacialis]